MRIGLAGVGLMGHGMASRLMAAGHELTLLANRNRVPVEDLIAKGASEAEGPEALARASEVIILCLPGSAEVEALVARMETGLRAGQIIVDASTSDPASTRALATRLGARGIGYADAPMAGGPEQVSAGEAGALIGAADEVLARISPLIACYCNRMAHFGDAGSGHAAKLVSNYLVTGMIALIADAFGTAHAAGVDAGKLYDVMLAGSGNSGALRKMAGPALAGDFDGYRFAIGNAAKDISYYCAMAEGLGRLTPLAEDTRAMFRRAVDDGRAADNVSRLLEGLMR